MLAIGVKEERINYKVGLLSIAGVIGIIGCILLISNSENASFLQAYQLLSYSKNYLNNWITANIYVFISLLTTGLVGVMYFHDTKTVGKNGNIEKAFVKLGNNSYTLYLFHWPILVVLKHLINYWWALFIGTFIISFIAMLVFNRLYT